MSMARGLATSVGWEKFVFDNAKRTMSSQHTTVFGIIVPLRPSGGSIIFCISMGVVFRSSLSEVRRFGSSSVHV